MGPGKLPQLARALGEALREFRRAAGGEYEEEREREARGEVRMPNLLLDLNSPI